MIAGVVLLLMQGVGMFLKPRPEWSRGSVVPGIVLVIVGSALRRRAARPR